ncbi:MAG: YraN family protein [Salinivirgaceae bacterium]|nr:YraN family protein [Salinivirgaceae bacterium]
MSEHNNIGRDGEDVAASYLMQKGYRIVARNWRYGPKEIDIVARDGETMVFVEVKTRSTLAFELPQEAVTKKKMKNLVEAADAYMLQYNIELEGRFDIVGVLNGNPPKVIEHIVGAWQANDLII